MIFRLWRTINVLSSSVSSTVNIAGCAFSQISVRLYETEIKMFGLKNRSNQFTSTSGQLSESPSDATNFTVVVEGNIGSGKSSLLNHFRSNRSSSIEVIGEPLEKWTNLQGHNALSLLYEDPQRWSFSFNMYALLTRVQMHMKPHNQHVKMLERSLYSTNYCFVENAFLNHTINEYEHAVLNQWFQYLVAGKKAKVDLIVYLRADPLVCYDRLKARSRKEEAGVPMSLIEDLHTLHDDWLLKKKFPLPAPVLVLDANSDLKTMYEVYDSRRQEILCGLC